MVALANAQPQPSKDNVIELIKIDGKLGKKPEVRYNKDGSVDRRHPNSVAGVSSEVYPFTTEEEIKAMIDVFNNRIENAPDDNKRMIACRNKMLFLIGINVGLRASDLVSLKWNFFLKEDGEFKDCYSLQPKKTKKHKKFVKLYFNQVVKKAVADYIEEYPIQDMDDYLFKSRKGDGAISERGLWKIVVDAADEAGIEKNVGSHTLRKTFGRFVWYNAVDKSKSLVVLQTIFNHSSPAVTSKYIGLTDDEVSEVFNELNIGIEYI